MDIRQLVERLSHLQVSSLCDADKTLPALDFAIRPILPGRTIAGPAFTVVAEDDYLSILAAVGLADPGSVLVITTNGGRRAVSGELFANESRRRGISGIVLDGYCRDLRGIRAVGLPVFARGANPMAGTMTTPPIHGTPIRCGGVDVRPGDIVFGDDDGVMIAPADRIEAALDEAERIERAERRVVAAMVRGESLYDHTNAVEHLQRIAAGQPSRFEFRT